MKGVLIVGLISLAGGAAGGWYGHTTYGKKLGGGVPQEEITARVLSKRTEEDRLLFMLRAKKNVTLVAFTERKAEIDSLVAVGDKIRIRIPKDTPIVDNPTILRVRPNKKRTAALLEALKNRDAGTMMNDAGTAEATEPDAGPSVRPKRRANTPDSGTDEPSESPTPPSPAASKNVEGENASALEPPRRGDARTPAEKPSAESAKSKEPSGAGSGAAARS